MRKVIQFLFYLALLVFFSGFNSSDSADNSACWGQATAVFAQMGEMGVHASEQPTPRLGIKNLASALADAGIIPDDSMQSLGAFVSTELGLSIEACQ